MFHRHMKNWHVLISQIVKKNEVDLQHFIVI